MSTDSWYPPSVINSPSSSRPATPGANTSSSFGTPRPTDRPNILSNVSPAEAAGIIAVLKDKSVDELRKLLSDKEAYQNLLLSVEPVKTQNRVRDELRNETLQLASKFSIRCNFSISFEYVVELKLTMLMISITGENLEKEPRIVELRNQCRIIRTSELATAQEKLHELERKKEETLKYYSPSSLLHRLEDAMSKTEEESETLHRQLLDGEIDLSAFVQKYKKMRYTYHKRALTHLAAKTSAIG
ncbi:hypothetical protein DH2020_026246 [Rehmannia glutinosa]|uniref:VPS37 C-terminal domain-containing protein n=1 Tax=Rehmannia glutinosa TaxID=99300 RepID=A0ABR0VXM9_REHGL